VKAPKSSQPEIRVPDLSALQNILDADTMDHILILTALFTGMRRGEILGLRWSDINWENGMISVVQQVQDIRGKGIVFKDKPKGARRNITAPRFLIAMLKKHKAEQNEIRLMHGADYQDNNLVFPRVDGSPERPSNLSHRFKNLVDSLGLSGMRFHDCRHVHATLLLGMDIAAGKVQERLGHKSIKLTIDTYSHVTPNMQEEIAEKLDTLFERLVNPDKSKTR
jgi:integrase